MGILGALLFGVFVTLSQGVVAGAEWFLVSNVPLQSKVAMKAIKDWVMSRGGTMPGLRAT